MNPAISAIVESKYDKCVTRCIYQMRRIPAKGWDSEDSPMRTLWDHWKREMQDQHSIFHNPIEEMVESVVRGVVNGLSHDDGALLTFGTDALDDLEQEPTEAIFAPDAVFDELLMRVNGRACDEPHRREVQRLLDAQDLDRFERDNEPYG